jgi:cytochrome c peroxidase
MTDNQEDLSNELYVPVILALLFVLFVAALVWITQVKPIADQAAVERATAAASGEEVAGTTAAEPTEATIAAFNAGGCTACHTIPGIPGAVGQIGPNLSNVGVDGASRRDGYTAEEYIFESIVEPNAFTVPDCPDGPCVAGLMPVPPLDEAQVKAIVTYLVTLGVTGEAVAEVEAEAEPVTEVELPAVALDPILEPVAPAEFALAFNRGGCAGCHTIPGIPGADGQVGPDLSEIGSTASTRISGSSAGEYIRESILDPNAFIAPECPTGGCPENVMLQTFAESLSQADLDLIVSYLSALGTDQAIALSEPAAVTSLEATLPAESVLEPFMPLPGDPASEAQIALGKFLFFDPRLSNNNSLSCASCHQPDKAFTDGEALSRGYPSTKYFRNVPSLYNTVFNDLLYWDGRMDGNDMPTLVRDHLTEAHFMANDGRLMVERLKQVPAYVELFNEASGSGPGFGGTLRAIAAYVQSLNSSPTPYDQFLTGDTDALSAEAQAGLALFEGQAQCSSCHSGDLLTDGDFYNTGVATDPAMFQDPELHVTFRRFFRILGVPNYRNLREDVGLFSLTIDQDDWGKFRTPGLREVGRTAPYMHNGSLATLEDVVHFYNDGGGPDQTAGLQSLELADDEIDQLVAFLESLSSEPVAVEVPPLPDYQLLTVGGSE